MEEEKEEKEEGVENGLRAKKEEGRRVSVGVFVLGDFFGDLGAAQLTLPRKIYRKTRF